MERFFPVLANCPLFDGIRQEDLSAMLSCLGTRVIRTQKNQLIFSEGDPADHVGIVLSGSVRIVKEDFFGNRSIVSRIEPAGLFGESFACANVGALPVSVIAAEDSSVMIMDCRRITHSCSNACEFHNRMIFNLLKVVANKNLVFNQKIDIISKRTTREKLMAYLMAQAKLHGSNSFTIPYDRQALADYLAVERSAMSAEISKLRKDGVIRCVKSRFTLL